nr:acyltransferase [Candidatus Freyarchaeota archaeon]
MKTKKLILSTREDTLAAKSIRTDLARVIAIILVIISHVYVPLTTHSLRSLGNFGIIGVGIALELYLSFGLTLIYFINYFGEIGVAIFFICSGANLTSSSFSLKEKFIKIYPAFILTYVVWNFVWPAPSLITLVSYVGLFNGFFGVSYSYFWFIPAMFGLYVLYPIIQKVVEHKVGIVFLISISLCCLIYTQLAASFLGWLNTYTSSTLNAIFPFVLGMITKKVNRKYGLLILLFSVVYFSGQKNLAGNITYLMYGIVPVLIAYGIFSISSNTFRTRWSDTTYVLYLLHVIVFIFLFTYLGLFGLVLSVPVLLFSGWYGTRLNNKFTAYLMKRVNREGNEKNKIIKKAKTFLDGAHN